MLYGAHLSTAGMMVNQYRQDVIANNLANTDTIGFKHDLAVVMERPVESKEDGDASQFANTFYDRLTGGSIVGKTWHAAQPGPSEMTNRDHDVMIDGPGFLQLRTPEGPRFTRDGRLVVAADGRLLGVASGHPVLDDGGQPITVDPALAPPIIAGDGTIRQGEDVTAKLGVFDFEDLQMLRKVGANQYVATENARPRLSETQLRPGFVEGSTADPVTGLTDMIQIARAFEMNANFLRLQDSTLGRLINDVVER